VTAPSAGRADGRLDAYLGEVEALLAGPRPWRVDVLAELRDGLEQAAEEYRARGFTAEEAARSAVADFGAPALVAAGFGREAAAVQARRVSGGLLATGPVVGGGWLATFAVTQPTLLDGLSGPLRVMPLVGVVVAVAVSAALLASTAAGRNVLRFASRPLLATTAAAMAAGMCAVGDVVVLATFGGWLATAPPLAAPAYLLSGLALTVSATRLVAAVFAVRQCVRTRARLA
jgi:hypothetical protein